MVSFKLIKKTKKELIYCYYPEGNETKAPGIIIVDCLSGEVRITQVAEDDSERMISPDELNELAEEINDYEEENETNESVETVTDYIRYVYYGDHAVREIKRCIRSGEILEKGMQSWY